MLGTVGIVAGRRCDVELFRLPFFEVLHLFFLEFERNKFFWSCFLPWQKSTVSHLRLYIWSDVALILIIVDQYEPIIVESILYTTILALD